MINLNEYYMRMALKEAQYASEKDEVPIGAVIISHGHVVAKAYNQVELLNDATAHAEMIAITSASNALGSKYLTDCAIYVTIEPCMMCAAALYWAKIGAIFYGAGDNKYGFTRFDNNLFTLSTHIEKGLMDHECSQLLKDFFKKKRE
ncbi:MAG: nucleoside deaminase [Chitinophagales bacterium]|nr:nucleoside deaminase [Chitinophagales bacterium]